MKHNDRMNAIKRFTAYWIMAALTLALVMPIDPGWNNAGHIWPGPGSAWAASLPAGISDEVKKFFPEVHEYKNRPTIGLGSKAVLPLPAFMETYNGLPEFKALIPSSIVKQLSDGSLENGEVQSVAVSHDNRLVTHINTPKGKFSVYRPISQKEADTFVAGAKWYSQQKSGKK